MSTYSLPQPSPSPHNITNPVCQTFLLSSSSQYTSPTKQGSGASTVPDTGPTAADYHARREQRTIIRDIRLEGLRAEIKYAAEGLLENHDYQWMAKPLGIMIDPLLVFLADQDARAELEKEFLETCMINMGADGAAYHASVDALVAGVGGLNADIALLKSKLAVVQVDIEILKADVIVMKENVSDLKDDVATLQADVIVIKADMFVMKEGITEMKEDIVEIRNDMVVMKGDIIGMKGDIENLQEDVATLKEDVTVIKSDIIDMKGDITTLKEDVTVMKADISTLKGGMLSIEQKLDQLLSLQMDKL